MSEHYTLWSSCSSRSKDDCSKVFALTLFELFFYLSFVFNTPFLANLHKFIKKKNFNICSLCSFNIVFFYIAFNRNKSFKGWKLVFKGNNFAYL